MKLSFDASLDDLQIFLQETDEQIALLDEAVLRLERDATPDLLQAIFRAAHTLKGSSASIGHTRMADLTHALEGVLDKLRKGSVAVSAALIDALLAGLDALRVLREEVVTAEAADLDLEPVLAQLHAVAAVEAPAAAASAVAPPPELVTGEAYQVEVELAKECLFPAVRAFQIVLALQSVGEVVWSNPSLAAIEAEHVGDRLSALVVPAASTDETPAQLEAAVRNVLEVASVSVHLHQPDGPPAGQERRVIDLGIEARGASDSEKLQLAAAKMQRMSKTIRFDVERLDELMNLVGELVIERTRLVQIASTLEEQIGENAHLGELREATVRLARITDELQQKTMSARMLPIESVFSRFPRTVRDLARKSGKEVELVIEGQETELDRSVIEQIGDPLLHLLRNAVDHAVEPPEERLAAGKPRAGRVRLAAYLSEGENEIVIQVQDDGRGIDAARLKAKAVERGLLTKEAAERMSEGEAIELIFAAGLSTAERVTDVSGRGVGMDIVRANIEKLNGSITIATQRGVGTTFTIRVPLTLAIIPVMLVGVGESVCAVPLVAVVETLRVRPSEIRRVRRAETVQLRGMVLPLLRLREVFGLPPAPAADWLFVLAVRWGDRQVGLVVDRLLGGQEIVIKPLGELFGTIEGVGGAMILGDGRVGLVLDVPGLVKRAVRERGAAA
ncbi:MAG: chemotaxis protein CheA [Chloroflexi bacterium]|nr:chemotaxis protein CheA [Chloroflexota bacterium]